MEAAERERFLNEELSTASKHVRMVCRSRTNLRGDANVRPLKPTGPHTALSINELPTNGRSTDHCPRRGKSHVCPRRQVMHRCVFTWRESVDRVTQPTRGGLAAV